MKKKILNKIFSKTLLDPPPDYFILGIIGFIILFGLVVLSSASSVISYQKYSSTYYLLIHQITVGVLPGLVLFYILYRVDYHFWKKWSLLILGGNILLLVALFVPGLAASYGYAKSWLSIGGFSLQPSEIIKLTLTIYLAAWFSIKTKQDLQHFRISFVPFVVLLGVVLGLVVLQPDVGTASIIVVIALTIFFVAGAKILHLIFFGGMGAALLTLLIFQAPYRFNRLLVFLHPGTDPEGIGYHLNQAILAVGSGGWLGRGFGKSIQKFSYLPEVTGDSIFAIIGEEIGFIFSALLIVLFIILMIKGFKLASNAPDNFGKYLVVGIITWIIFQSFINIAAMIGLAPLTGVPLPFISYGGTSLMTLFAAAGLLANVSRQRHN
ncbi:putative lipid II flippase FtsW [Patescibacteria group bacterium]|nr:putative lipid II flippase FtsW [Patescibacteria group bacterium]